MTKSKLVAAALISAFIAPGIVQAQATNPTNPAPAAAPATAGVAAGAKVFDSAGVEVGTIEKVEGDNVVVAIGANRATLAKSAFASAPGGVSVAATKAQLDSALAAASAQAGATLDAALVANAEVKSQDGAVVGKIKEVNGDQVVLERPDGPVSLARQFFSSEGNGLTLRMTAAQLDAAAKAAQPAG